MDIFLAVEKMTIATAVPTQCTSAFGPKLLRTRHPALRNIQACGMVGCARPCLPILLIISVCDLILLLSLCVHAQTCELGTLQLLRYYAYPSLASRQVALICLCQNVSLYFDRKKFNRTLPALNYITLVNIISSRHARVYGHIHYCSINVVC